MPRVKDVDELNRHLLTFCEAERSRVVRGQTESIGVRFEREKTLALPLPPRPFDACVSRCGQSDKYQTVLFENNRYSVPRTSAFAPVTIKAYIDRIRIMHGQQVVATHSRSYGQHESVLDPMHYLTTLSRKPACLDHASVFRDWRLPAVFDELRHTMERAHGPRTGVRHYIRVLQLLRSHPASRIEAAIRRCHQRQHPDGRDHCREGVVAHER